MCMYTKLKKGQMYGHVATAEKVKCGLTFSTNGNHPYNYLLHFTCVKAVKFTHECRYNCATVKTCTLTNIKDLDGFQCVWAS